MSQPLDLTNEVEGYEYVMCLDCDLVDRDPPDQCMSIHVI